MLRIAIVRPAFRPTPHRALSDLCGQWSFPGERPLAREEVLAAVLFEKTLWPLVSTWYLMLRKRGAGAQTAV